MTLTEWKKLESDGFHPLPGRCVIQLDAPPTTSGTGPGTIHIPQSAQLHEVKASGYTGTVLAVNPLGEWKRDKTTFDSLCRERDGAKFKAGDRVVLGIHADELREEVIWARNGQVEAVIVAQPHLGF